ncbi:MAG TPA: MarR family transcriptional regulator [Gammaproteobacteria bacterium]|nr:MarR family transcriptional regulator [Gammaproteobacteria bacterium]
MGELASMLTVTKGNITGVVRRLKENGLVRKVILKSDRRMQSVTISGKGRLWGRMHADYDSIISRILSAQTEKELRSLTRTLKKTRAAVEEISSELWGLDNIHG